MSRFPRFLILFLALSLLFAACRPQTADRRPQADGGQPTVSSPAPTLTPTPQPTPTETPIPQPSLESLGLFAETQALLKRQGWDIAWDAQNTRYLIRQRAFDEASQTFTSQLTHEVGWIDLEGNLHFTATYYSASENPDGTWKDTSTQSDIVVDLKNLPKNPDLIIKQQLDENGNPISFQEKLKTPGFHLLETKNPAFEKTGILSITIEINGTPTTFVYNRELGFLQMPELSTDFVNPIPLPIEYVHSLAAHQFILLQFGEPPAFPKSAYQDKNGKNIFPGWAIQFQYKDKDRDGNPIPDGIKVAYLWPRNGKTEIYNPVFQKDGKVLWFMLINPQDGTGYVSTVFRVFNPQNPQNPQNGDDQLLIFGTIGSFMNREEREIDSRSYNNFEDQMKRGNDNPLVLAQEGGYYRAIRNEPSLDSLLGMEGNDVGQVPYEGYKDWGNYHYFDIFAEGFSGVEKSSIRIYETQNLLETQAFNTPIPFTLQQFVLVISP
jgi:hypothetical protein